MPTNHTESDLKDRIVNAISNFNLHDPYDPYRNLRYGASAGIILGLVGGLLKDPYPSDKETEEDQEIERRSRLKQGLIGAASGAALMGLAGYYVPRGITQAAGRIITNIRAPETYVAPGRRNIEMKEEDTFTDKINKILSDRTYVTPAHGDLAREWADRPLRSKIKHMAKAIIKDEPLYGLSSGTYKDREEVYRRGFFLKPRAEGKYNIKKKSPGRYTFDEDSALESWRRAFKKGGNVWGGHPILANTYVDDKGRYADPWDFAVNTNESSNTGLELIRTLVDSIHSPITIEGKVPEELR